MTAHTQILTNATIYTDAFAPAGEAVAVKDGRVLASGSLDDVRAAAGPGASVADLDGATVIPGLVESHVHPIFFGLTRDWADCRSPQHESIPQVVQTLRRHLADGVGGGWVRGWGYDDTLLKERRHPTRDDLDAVSESVPVVVSHISGHFLVANSKALEIAGVHDETPDPPEGKLIRDSGGRLTGLMWEIGAVHLILDSFPRPEARQLREAAEYTLGVAASRGMTTIHDLGIGLMGGVDELDAWEHLAAQQAMPVRVQGYLRGDLAQDLLSREPDLYRRRRAGQFHLAGAKYWADGSIQGLSAALGQPYSCAADQCGELLFDFDELFSLVKTIDAAGGQCAVHANGDRAIRTVTDVFAKVRADGGRHDARHRVEHLQMASAEDIADLVAAGGVASIFANHIYYWGDRHRDIFIGEGRAGRLNPTAEAVTQGLHFGLHSDCPITPMDALRTLWTAVSRQTSSGETLGPDERLTRAQALHAMTADSAWLTGLENRSGRLLPGMDADLAVVDTDLLTADDDGLSDVGVLGTMVGGQWVYQR